VSLATSVTRGRTFTSLRKHRNYRLYFSGQVISISGTFVQNVAQAWLVLELTHSPTAVGLLAACQFGPFALLGLFGGVVIDRRDIRHILMATQTASMIFATILGVLTLTHVITVWQVFVLAALNGSVTIFDSPARQSFTMEMVGRDELPNAIALNSSLFNASRVMGPAIGGLLIAWTGVGVCFVVNAASFLAVLLCLWLMRAHELNHPVRAGRPTMVRGLLEGVDYARRTPQVLMILVMMVLIAMMAINFNVLLPVLASHTLNSGPQVFGMLSACFGGGALCGALLVAWRGRTSWPVLFGGALGLGGGELLLAPQHSLAACAALLVVSGTSFSMYTANSNATLQMATPDHLRGRVLSLYSYAFFGTAPLGGLLAGWLADKGGTELAFAVGGAVALITGTAGLVWWRLQQRNDHGSDRNSARSAPAPKGAAALEERRGG
jgi:MFS family permease